MTERIRELTDLVGPIFKEAASPIKPAVHSLVEALKNFLRPLIEFSHWRLRNEEFINKARIINQAPLVRLLALF